LQYEIENISDNKIEIIFSLSSSPRTISNQIPLTISSKEIKSGLVPFTINTNIKAGSFKITGKIIDGSDSSKVYDVKSFTTPLDIIIKEFEITPKKTSYSLSDSIDIKVTIDLGKLRAKSVMEIDAYEENNTKTINLITQVVIPRASGTNSNSFPIPITQFGSDPGKYALKCKVTDQVKNSIEHEKKKFIHVERFLSSINVSKKIVKYKETFNETINFVNPLSSDINGELEIQYMCPLKTSPSKKIQIIIPANNTKYSVESPEFSFTDDYPEDMYDIYAQFKIDSPSGYSRQDLYSSIILEKPEGSIFSLDWAKDIDMTIPALKRASGRIEINTLHYLFRRLDSPNGLDIIRFWEGIAVLLWEANKNEFQEMGIEWWQWEEKFINNVIPLLSKAEEK
ncbi:MAG: hypothetical protein ACFFCS_20345, partial [Candidatus Hodarchaeota archaeon]